MRLGGDARQRRCRAIPPADRRATRGCTDPPTVEEIVAVMRQAADNRHGWRVRAMIVVLWRSGLRIQEALVLGGHDLDRRRGSVLVRNGKGGRRREVGMDEWGWEELRPWLHARAELPAGPLFCIIDGPTRGRPWSSANVRVEFRRLAAQAEIRRRFAPNQLRHATPSNSPAKACRSTSSSASSATEESDPAASWGAGLPVAAPFRAKH
jgi:site-specific recombinase XerC